MMESHNDEKLPTRVESIMQRSYDLTSQDNDVVRFEPGDLENPQNWPTSKKWPIVASYAMMNMISFFATTTIIPAAPQVMQDFQITSTTYRTLLVSIWELGEGIGPFLIGPLSERYGRLPVYHVGNFLGLVCAIAGALSTNISMLVTFRFLSGCVSVPLTLTPAVIGDLFAVEQRGTAMAVAMALAQIGVFVAPVAGSFIAQALGWRWTIWIVAIAIAVIAGPSVFFVRETYEVKILERKTLRLDKLTGKSHLRSQHHVDMTVSARSVVQGFAVPVRTLIHSPLVFLIAIYTAYSYALAYLIVATLTEVMEDTYSFNRGVVGLTFLAAAIGNVIGMIFYGCTSDRYLKSGKELSNDKTIPERRLVYLVLGSVSLPLGFFLYGWTLYARVAWIVPLIGTAIVGFSMMITVLSTENYLVDTFGIHSASAISAGVIVRAISGALLPLAGPPLYEKIGLGWGNSVWAFLAMVFIPPVVWLVKYGNEIRHS